jgi:hypothetical protein
MSRRTHGPPEDLLDDWGSCEFASSFRQKATHAWPTWQSDITAARFVSVPFCRAKVSMFRNDRVRESDRDVG